MPSTTSTPASFSVSTLVRSTAAEGRGARVRGSCEQRKREGPWLCSPSCSR
jgi:hypothetical protein